MKNKFYFVSCYVGTTPCEKFVFTNSQLLAAQKFVSYLKKYNIINNDVSFLFENDKIFSMGNENTITYKLVKITNCYVTVSIADYLT